MLPVTPPVSPLAPPGGSGTNSGLSHISHVFCKIQFGKNEKKETKIAITILVYIFPISYKTRFLLFVISENVVPYKLETTVTLLIHSRE